MWSLRFSEIITSYQVYMKLNYHFSFREIENGTISEAGLGCTAESFLEPRIHHVKLGKGSVLCPSEDLQYILSWRLGNVFLQTNLGNSFVSLLLAYMKIEFVNIISCLQMGMSSLSTWSFFFNFASFLMKNKPNKVSKKQARKQIVGTIEQLFCGKERRRRANVLN